MPTLAQRSFSGGEISPDLFARCDTVKYATGVRKLLNMFVKRSGGASNRPSTKFIGEVKDSTKTVRLIKFIFNNAQTYMLEFGNLYMRVIYQGSYLTLTGQAITAMTHAAEAVFTYTGSDTYANGDEIIISGIAGALGQYLNGRNFKISDVSTGANTFKLKLMDGSTYFDSSALPAYTSGGLAEEIYEITTQYLEADLPLLKYDQSADVITIVHGDYPPAELTRTGHVSWTLNYEIFNSPYLTIGSGFTVSDNPWSSGTTFMNRYAITAVDDGGGESLPCDDGIVKSISSITKALPAVVTHTANSAEGRYENGDTVHFASLVGMDELKNQDFIITRIDNVSFSLNGVDSTNFTTFVSGSVLRRYTQTLSSAAFSSSNKNTITFPPANVRPDNVTSGSARHVIGHNIYREKNGVFGYLDFRGVSTSAIVFVDNDSLTPDLSVTPPVRSPLFLLEDDFPSAVAYIQQRRALAATNDSPDEISLSKIGDFSNLSTHRPVQADDAITFFMVGSRIERVRHVIDLGEMVVFNGGGEWKAVGQNGALIPGEINTKQQSYNGCSDLRPIVLNDTALYVQERGSIVRDLNFDLGTDKYRGDDLTTYSNHLVDGHEIVDWDYQKIPNSILWMVRDDGVVLGLTYVKGEQIVAWHRHEFENGTVENVCAIPEGTYDAIYMVIKRVINGRTVRYVERLESRVFSDIRDANFCDSGLYYDGRGNGSVTMTLSGGTTWVAGQNLTCTASLATFAATNVGDGVNLQVVDTLGVTRYVRCTITAYTSTTVVTVQPDVLVHASLRSTALTDWALAVDTLDGLWHLEGQDVSILADGFVVASPLNSDYDTFTVTNGRITLDANYGVIRIGLPITSDIETLNIDTPSGETVENKSKLISAVTVWMQNTRGGFYGPRDPSEKEGWAGDIIQNLEEFKQREYEADNEPTRMLTDAVNLNIDGQWNSNGRVFIRQIDPLPMTINAIAPAGLVPFQSGGG